MYVKIESEDVTVERRGDPLPDQGEVAALLYNLAYALRALELPRLMLFLARLIDAVADMDDSPTMRNAMGEAEDDLIGAARAVIEAWDSSDESLYGRPAIDLDERDVFGWPVGPDTGVSDVSQPSQPEQCCGQPEQCEVACDAKVAESSVKDLGDGWYEVAGSILLDFDKLIALFQNANNSVWRSTQ